MGGGSWTTSAHASYSVSRGRSVDSSGFVTTNYKSASQAYTSVSLDEDLDPKNIIRECVDSEEHPNTIPVILALDVTGSMGSTAIEVSKKLGIIMNRLFENVKDIEFCVMGIGDLAYDDAPIQMSQFESDVRIAENLDKIYFESGGGGNDYESYTAAWYMGASHTKLDCLKRGRKGIIITMGDEELNPYLPERALARATGDQLSADVTTRALYEKTSKMFDIFHIYVDHSAWRDAEKCMASFAKVIGEDNVFRSHVNGLDETIINIITNAVSAGEKTLLTESTPKSNVDENGEIVW